MILEDAQELAVPARSKLFCEPMMGTCGATQESMCDYVQRLAIMHGIGTWRFIREIVLPTARNLTLGSSASDESISCFYGCNGAGRFAKAIGLAMAQLTGRNDLAMGQLVRWRGLLGTRTGAQRHRRWCPACLSSFGNGEYVSHALIWSIPCVRVCPLHRVSLSETCGHCGRAQPFVGDAFPFGKCKWCLAPLSASISSANETGLLPYDFAIAECAADLVSANAQLAASADSQLIARELKRIAMELSNGTIVGLVARLKLRQSSAVINALALSPELFFDLMCRLGTKPSQFLSGNANCVIDDEMTSVSVGIARHKLKPAEVEDIRLRLEALIGPALRKPWHHLRLTDLSAQVGLRYGTFVNHFPDLAAEVVRLNRATVKSDLDERWRVKGERLKRAVAAHFPDGYVPTLAQMRTLCAKIRFPTHGARTVDLLKEVIASRSMDNQMVKLQGPEGGQ